MAEAAVAAMPVGRGGRGKHGDMTPTAQGHGEDEEVMPAVPTPASPQHPAKDRANRLLQQHSLFLSLR